MNHDAKDSTGKVQQDNVGKNEQGIDQVLKYEYNVKGELISEFKDNNVDGIYDVRESKVLNANGKVVETQLDYTNDGKVDKVTKNTLNAKGEVLESKYYNQATDGVQTYIGGDAFERDGNSYVIKKTSYVSSGAVKVVETYETDEQGRVLKKLIDNGGNGSVERAEIYTLDANGYVLIRGIDNGNTGSVDSKDIYVNDASGRIVEVLSQIGEDVPYRKTTRTYDIYGNVVKNEIDNGNDGSVNTREVREFNELGYMTSNTNINVDSGSVVIYRHAEYDAAGRVIRTLITNSNDNYQTENYYQHTYGETGLVTRTEYGDNIVGIRGYELWEYNNLLQRSKLILMNKDNSINYIREQFYNENGDWVLSFLDSKGDGTIESLAFGRGGYISATVDHSENLTLWSAEKLAPLAKNALTSISLSDSSNKSTLTLDKSVISQIASKISLTINGDASDTVNLNGLNQSNKLENTVTKNGQVYDQYQFNDNGTTYTVFVDSDINTVLG